jgi:hypothetical protein
LYSTQFHDLYAIVESILHDIPCGEIFPMCGDYAFHDFHTRDLVLTCLYMGGVPDLHECRIALLLLTTVRTLPIGNICISEIMYPTTIITFGRRLRAGY